MGFKMRYKRSFGDCTSVYSMSFGNGMTVREFIDAVLKKKREWGCISFDNEDGSIWYRYGKIEDGDIDRFMDHQIRKGSANGGYTRMDYRLIIKPAEKTESETKTMTDGMTDIQKMLAERNITAKICINPDDTTPVRTPGVIGICTTKNKNLMVYMVNENGKLFNTSVHTDIHAANSRVIQRAMAAYN